MVDMVPLKVLESQAWELEVEGNILCLRWRSSYDREKFLYDFDGLAEVRTGHVHYKKYEKVYKIVQVEKYSSQFHHHQGLINIRIKERCRRGGGGLLRDYIEC